MKTMKWISAAALFLAVTATAQAQVFVRAPFVRVQAGGGGGTYVRVPFVRVYVPAREYVGPIYVAPMPAPTNQVPPPENPDLAPPKPLPAGKTMTISEFSKSFQPRAGSYDVAVMNPATNEPTAVRFTLPAGKPAVQVRGNQIEFRYGPRSFVRIDFDRDGAIVTSR